MKDTTLNMIHQKLERNNTIKCPINKKILISHNSENTRCVHDNCLLFCGETNNCSMKTRIFNNEKIQKKKYFFENLSN